jgi:hypothetical protein
MFNMAYIANEELENCIFSTGWTVLGVMGVLPVTLER